MGRAILPWFLLAGASIIVPTPGCDDGVGGPAPCIEDLECEPACEAACIPADVTSAICDEFLRACVCDCDDAGAGGNGGHGGMGGGA